MAQFRIGPATRSDPRPVGGAHWLAVLLSSPGAGINSTFPYTQRGPQPACVLFKQSEPKPRFASMLA